MAICSWGTPSPTPDPDPRHFLGLMGPQRIENDDTPRPVSCAPPAAVRLSGFDLASRGPHLAAEGRWLWLDPDLGNPSVDGLASRPCCSEHAASVQAWSPHLSCAPQTPQTRSGTCMAVLLEGWLGSHLLQVALPALRTPSAPPHFPGDLVSWDPTAALFASGPGGSAHSGNAGSSRNAV